jgi:hypothetical protein
VAVIGGAAALAALAPREPSDLPRSAGAAAPAAVSTERQGSTPERFARLPQREAIGNRRGELFPSQSWTPPAAPAPAGPAVASAPPAPVAPPMPYRVAGRVVSEGSAQVVLAKGDRVITVREGDTLEDGYRVESIGAQGVTLVYVPMNLAQQLPALAGLELETAIAATVANANAPAPALADERTAQLRWEGPARTRAGDAFNVTLKVTAPHAVRSAPLQISFDAAQLEAVEVRRGGFFAEGSFSYRINPSGSIFIGAAGKGAVPADAEFFVLTFKPVRPGPAELKLSSVLLQGAAGRAIAHDQPAAFRTAIVQ